MTCSCKSCGLSFEITDADLAFYEKVSPVFGGRKFLIPPPTHCPECRQQRRLAMCNEQNLYPATCNRCRKAMISQFYPDHPFPVYCRDCWHGGEWDPRSYGRDIDFNQPFFKQFAALQEIVPAQGRDVQGTLVNCEYIHFAGSSKNCYLVMHADFCEDCYYGYGFKKNVACVDGFYNLHCELCYDCIDVHRCYGLIGSQECVNCHASWFLRDCVGCKDCILCVGLREKQYCIENQQYSQEEYAVMKQKFDLGSYRAYQSLKARRRELELKHLFKEYQGHNLQNCSGNHLYNCKNTLESYDCEDVEDGKHCYQVVLGAQNIHDVYQYGTNLQESYECTICGENSYHLLFCFGGHVDSSDLLYCWYMESCKDCFGCTFMHHQRYCILNKQYTREEYEKLAARLTQHMKQTGEWGEHFPMVSSLFGYNHTTAQLYYPLTKEDAERRGARWSEYEPSPPKVEKVIPADRLPDSIDDIPDDVLNWAIECEVTLKPFLIQKAELAFYRKMRLPIPRRHWLQRHTDRFRQRNPRKLWHRSCVKCGKDMQTTYSPERPEIVYCEECYLKAVY